MTGFSAIRKAGLALIVAASAGLALSATATEASAQGRHGGWHHGGGHHGWHGGGWKHGGWHHGWNGGGWRHRHGAQFLTYPVYGPRCHVVVRWMDGPYGPHRVVRRVCPNY